MPPVSASLKVNGTDIVLDKFTQSLITHTVLGMLGALKGGEDVAIDAAHVAIQGDKIDITINGTAIPVNPFVHDVVRSTLTSMVGRLRGVAPPVQSLDLRLS